MSRFAECRYHGAPLCPCLSRAQKKVGYLEWRCSRCGRVNCYRLTASGFGAFTPEVAAEIDRERRYDSR